MKEIIVCFNLLQMHLTEVLFERKESSFQSTYTKSHKTASERRAVQLQGFGPFDEDELVGELVVYSY